MAEERKHGDETFGLDTPGLGTLSWVPAGVLTQSEVDPLDEQEAQTSLTIISDELSRYGFEGAALDELVGLAYEMLIEAMPYENMVINLQKADAFKTRFAGMELRREREHKAISVSAYLDLERAYKDTMMKAGIPESFYDDHGDFAEFIGNDVSQLEFDSRVGMAAKAMKNLDPFLKDQLAELYGIGVESDGELLAFYLDPDRGTDVVEQRLQMEAAGLSAAAKGTLGQGFDKKTAEQLVNNNIQGREITERLKDQAGLRTRLLGEESAATSSELAASTFGLDSESVANMRNLRQKRQGVGTRKSGAVIGQGGIAGFGRGT